MKREITRLQLLIASLDWVNGDLCVAAEQLNICILYAHTHADQFKCVYRRVAAQNSMHNLKFIWVIAFYALHSHTLSHAPYERMAHWQTTRAEYSLRCCCLIVRTYIFIHRVLWSPGRTLRMYIVQAYSNIPHRTDSKRNAKTHTHNPFNFDYYAHVPIAIATIALSL